MNNRIEMLKAYLKEDPEDIFSNYALALEYLNIGENSLSCEMLENILKKDEQYLAAYYQLGKVYEKTGRTEDAKRIYEKGTTIALNQRNQRTLNELRSAYDSLNDE